MLKIENTEVLGWEHAIRGMRNPMNSWEKSDSSWRYVAPAQRESHILASYFDDSEFWIGPNDADLMSRLRNAGTDHRKFMRMITDIFRMSGRMRTVILDGDIAEKGSHLKKGCTREHFYTQHLAEVPGWICQH